MAAAAVPDDFAAVLQLLPTRELFTITVPCVVFTFAVCVCTNAYVCDMIVFSTTR